MRYGASAPAKAILFGEHGVNRRQPALAIAVDRRVSCWAGVRPDQDFHLAAAGQRTSCTGNQLLSFKAMIDEWRETEALDTLRAQTKDDFFAPTRYVLAHVAQRWDLPGLDVTWHSAVPQGAGLGSGAAASAALAHVAISAAGGSPQMSDVALLAWQGDIIAHGGIASGLDSGACAFGGLTRYTLAAGSEPLPATSLPLVIGDTEVRAHTGDVNTRLRHWLGEHPQRMHLFAEIGLLVEQAQAALLHGDLPRLGHLMNLNQLILEKLGVSCPEIERLIEAALATGALGAKLSGSGGGGIVVALTHPGTEDAVAAAIEQAGGRALIAPTAAPGVRAESDPTAA